MTHLWGRHQFCLNKRHISESKIHPSEKKMEDLREIINLERKNGKRMERKKTQICVREEQRQICVDEMGNYTRPGNIMRINGKCTKLHLFTSDEHMFSVL